MMPPLAEQLRPQTLEEVVGQPGLMDVFADGLPLPVASLQRTRRVMSSDFARHPLDVPAREE